WFWRSLRPLMLGVAAAALLAIALYGGAAPRRYGADLGRAESVFLPKYSLSSQSAILWMGVLFAMSTVFYWIGLLAKGDDGAAARIGSPLPPACGFVALTHAGL